MNEGEEEDEKVYTKAQKGRKDVKNKEKKLESFTFYSTKKLFFSHFFLLYFKAIRDVSFSSFRFLHLYLHRFQFFFSYYKEELVMKIKEKIYEEYYGLVNAFLCLHSFKFSSNTHSLFLACSIIPLSHFHKCYQDLLR